MLGVLLQIIIISCLTAMTDWSHQVPIPVHLARNQREERRGDGGMGIAVLSICVLRWLVAGGLCGE